MSIEISLKTPEGWNAHNRRDFIDKVLLEGETKSVKLYTEVLNLWKRDNVSEALLVDNLPWERLARFSFSYKGLETFDLSITPVYPEGLKAICLEAIKKDQEIVNKSVLMKPLNWVIKKMLDEKEIKEVETDISEMSFKKQMELWDMAVATGYMAILRPLFEEFKEGEVTFMIKENQKIKMDIASFFRLKDSNSKTSVRGNPSA